MRLRPPTLLLRLLLDMLLLLLGLAWQEKHRLIRTLHVTVRWMLLLFCRTVWLLLYYVRVMLFPVLGVVADALMRVGSLGMSPILLLIYRYLVVIVGGR